MRILQMHRTIIYKIYLYFTANVLLKFNNYGAMLLQNKKLIPQTGTTGITFKSSEMVK